MLNDFTICPNCHQQSVAEQLTCYQCVDCGHWGFSVNKIIYEPEQEYRPSGQVCRKPRAA
jgi:hypothetical protein